MKLHNIVFTPELLDMLVNHFAYSIQDINSYDELTEKEKAICSREIFDNITDKNAYSLYFSIKLNENGEIVINQISSKFDDINRYDSLDNLIFGTNLKNFELRAKSISEVVKLHPIYQGEYLEVKTPNNDILIYPILNVYDEVRTVTFLEDIEVNSIKKIVVNKGVKSESFPTDHKFPIRSKIRLELG